LSVCHVRTFCQNEYSYPQTFLIVWLTHHSSFFRTKREGNIPTRLPLTGAPYARRYEKFKKRYKIQLYLQWRTNRKSYM